MPLFNINFWELVFATLLCTIFHSRLYIYLPQKLCCLWPLWACFCLAFNFSILCEEFVFGVFSETCIIWPQSSENQQLFIAILWERGKKNTSCKINLQNINIFNIWNVDKIHPEVFMLGPNLFWTYSLN